ncbi:glycoside hydrolase family 30 protein [Gorillibacterium timonense]|uniref:glycoside hydrolase family 30 protein n=1 Tax=Gorillibacterium timonense TaxID=1689269 RepID=UPI00071D041F|nr:glycoside hydrolase family 30 protein [Gorillibacterium timonense]
MIQAKIYITAQETGERWSEQAPATLEKRTAGQTADLELDPSKTYQTMLGFGGAFTEAAAYTLSRVSPENRAAAIRNYFDPVEGLGYTIGRVHIHSCDFALGNYTYVEDNDTELKTFDISHDRELILPLIKDAARVKGGTLQLLASPWSPPAWMKTNGEMNHGGQLKPEYRDAWALYYTKFIRAYEAENVPIWAITVQNEPAAVQVWDSCIYSGEEERDFVRDHLGPTMHREGLEQVKILIWDHNRDLMVDRASAVLNDPEAAKYVWGTGFHWYVSEDFSAVGQVHDLFPDKHLLFTEGCQEGGVKLGEWFTGERYGRNMIGDLNNWCEGYLDWNLVLDETGGPNHVNNLCDAPIIADTVTDTLHLNSSYSYIGHFSRYIRPGAVRIGLVNTHAAVQATAFRNPEGTLAVVAQNESDAPQSLTLGLAGSILTRELPAHSIATFVLAG